MDEFKQRVLQFFAPVMGDRVQEVGLSILAFLLTLIVGYFTFNWMIREMCQTFADMFIQEAGMMPAWIPDLSWGHLGSGDGPIFWTSELKLFEKVKTENLALLWWNKSFFHVCVIDLGSTNRISHVTNCGFQNEIPTELE